MVRDVEAQHVSDDDWAEIESTRLITGQHVSWDLGVHALIDLAGQGPQRDVLAVRHEVPLLVLIARAGFRVPGDADVLAGRVGRPVENGTDEHRDTDGLHGTLDLCAHFGVRERVEVGAVLRPQHHVDGLLVTRLDVGRQVERARHVIVDDLELLGGPIGAATFDITLHESDPDALVSGGHTDWQCDR